MLADMTYDDFSFSPTGASIAPITDIARLSDAWAITVGALGFTRRTLWMLLISSSGQPLHAVRLDDAPASFDEEIAQNLVDLVRELAHSRMTAAFLYARPGGGPRTDEDLSWASGITAHLRRNGLPVWPVHLATDDELSASVPEDLAAAG